MYNQRNFNPSSYTYQNMSKLGQAKVLFADFVSNVAQAKAVCLAKNDREVETPMFALEKDEDFFP